MGHRASCSKPQFVDAPLLVIIEPYSHPTPKLVHRIFQLDTFPFHMNNRMCRSNIDGLSTSNGWENLVWENDMESFIWKNNKHVY